MNLKELKLLWPFYLGIFIAGITNAAEAIYVVFFLSKELAFVQISFLVALITFGRLFFEIPTGAIADLFGRKRSVIMGWIGSGSTFAMIPFFNTFKGLFFIILISTFFSTLVTGADTAWIVDYLKKKKVNTTI